MDSQQAATQTSFRLRSVALREPEISAVLFVACAACLVSATPAQASECTTVRASQRLAEGSIGFVPDDSVPEALVDEAIDRWAVCSNYGDDFPTLSSVDGAPLYEVRLEKEHPIDQVCGSFRGRTITLYSWTRDRLGKRVSCGPMDLVLAHEMGHALGLLDSPPSGSCQTRIMSHVVLRNRLLRRVREDECQAVGQRWLSAVELERERRGKDGWPATAVAEAEVEEAPVAPAAAVWTTESEALPIESVLGKVGGF